MEPESAGNTAADETLSPNDHLDRRRVLRHFLSTATVFPPLRGFFLEQESAKGQRADRHTSARPARNETSLFAPSVFTPHQFETMDLISERIIPQTRTAGARAAKVAQFIDRFLAEGEDQLRSEVVAGLGWLDQRSKDLFGQDFISARPTQQVDLLTRISTANSSEASIGRLFFHRAKSLTIFGYYTSKEGLTEELGYSGPSGIGTYEGSVPIKVTN